MTENSERLRPRLTRRGFLKAAGFGTAAMFIPSFLVGCGADASAAGAATTSAAAMGLTTNSGATSMASAEQRQINTDVLVIGGGMAGAFAAVRAREAGLNVTLVDKGTVGRSGATPWACAFSVFDEAAGDDRDEWIANASSSSEYVNNLDWLDQMMDESKTCWDDLNKWGLFDDDVRHSSFVLRDKLMESGVNLVERTMMTTLLTQEIEGENHVVGAMGFTLDGEQVITVLAKATVMAAGAGSFKAPGFPIQGLTSDGDAMAYRVGATISGKEWMDFHFTYAEYPASCWYQWSGMWDNGIGRKSGMFTSSPTLSSAFAIHTGEQTQGGSGGPPSDGGGHSGPPSDEDGERPLSPPSDGENGEAPSEPPSGEDGEQPSGPPPDGENGAAPSGSPPGDEGGEGGPGGGPGQGMGEQVLGAAMGLGIHKAEGVWPTDMHGASGVPGLYAAGDGLASMLCGAAYNGAGVGLSGSATQGAAAGEGAAAYALTVAAPEMSEDELAEVRTAMLAPRERESGFSPAWVTQILQNTTFPYFVLLVKEEQRLEAALSTVIFLRKHLVPRLTAEDAHDLKLAHETANMVLNAEMKLRASLFRTESRGTHYREDYPARDDDNWLAWVLLKEGEDGEMAVFKEEMPDEWKPDPRVPYEERYPSRFPGELEYLGLA